MSKRCLMVYSGDFEETAHAALMLSYSRALRDAGYRLDCYTLKSDCRSMLDRGVFENVFVAPDRDVPVSSHLEGLGDEASMVAAGVLASISDYDVVGIEYGRWHLLRKILPPGLPVVMFTHDLDPLAGRQEEMIFGRSADCKLAEEVSRLKPFSLVTVVGPHDERLLRSLEPGMPVVEAPYTLTVEKGAGTIREDSPGVLLWISSAAPVHRLSYLWFWENVWPRIRSARPQCRLIVAGPISHVAKQSGAADPQVSVLGVVGHTSRLYHDADVLLAPYSVGLGVKTDVIEALGKGIPVATTSLGIYNTRIEPGREAIVSDQASEYASQVIELISSPAMRRELACNGREYIRRWHDRHTALRTLVEAFERLSLVSSKPVRTRTSILRVLNKPLQYLALWTADRCRADNVSSVALYGAGSHTQFLVPIWKALGAPPIRKIVVTGEPPGPSFMGLPVVSAGDFNSAEVDAIVLSSCEHEQAMATTCRERWPELKVYSIWKPIPVARDFEPVRDKNIPAREPAVRSAAGAGICVT
jgi:Glycosyl transferases group 1